MLIYIHGFNSSPASHKAQVLTEYFRQHNSTAFIAPTLHHRPALAIAELERLINESTPAEVTLVGSSLGGFYANWLVEKYGCKAILINPAVAANKLLLDYLGAQTNMATGEEYILTTEHLTELSAFAVDEIEDASRYLLLVQTGDEVLDYRDAVKKYHASRQIVIPGGDHGFNDFASFIPVIMEFAAA